MRKGRSRRAASVTVGLIAPGVHLGSGKGSPLRTWTRHGLRSAARPSGRDARGFTDSTIGTGDLCGDPGKERNGGGADDDAVLIMRIR